MVYCGVCLCAGHIPSCACTGDLCVCLCAVLCCAALCCPAGVAELEAAGGDGREWGVCMLRQHASHLHFTAAEYGDAVREARAVYDVLCEAGGEQSGEALLFSLRLGVLEAGGLGWVVGWGAGFRGLRLGRGGRSAGQCGVGAMTSAGWVY